LWALERGRITVLIAWQILQLAIFLTELRRCQLAPAPFPKKKKKKKKKKEEEEEEEEAGLVVMGPKKG
jgi:hypothetical protein